MDNYKKFLTSFERVTINMFLLLIIDGSLLVCYIPVATMRQTGYFDMREISRLKEIDGNGVNL